MASFDAFPRSLGQALTGTIQATSKPIVVPVWQRSYAWRDSDVDQFWNDLVAFSETCPKEMRGTPQYFLGSIVLVTRDNSETHTLLDGQQRLVTSTLLLAAIRDHILETADADDEASRLLAIDIDRKFIVSRDEFAGTEEHRITLNRYDRTYFRDFIQEPAGGTADLTLPTSLDSHKLLRKAYQTLIKRLREHLAEKSPEEGNIRWPFWLTRILTQNLVVIVATSDDEDTAAEIFETLNDRGVGLSTPDLLRNLLLRKSAEDHQEEIVDYWRDILRIDEARTDLFLRHFWISQKGDVKKHSLYRAMRDDLITHDDDADYPLQFTKDLTSAAQVYQEIVASRDDDDEVRTLLRGLNLLDAGVLRPALLSAWDKGEGAERARVLRTLIAFFIRHRVIVGLENNELERIVFTLAERLRRDGDFEAALTTLRAAPPTDDEFEKAFVTATVTRANTVRYLLMEFERARHEHQELAVETAARVHIEHIYPRNPARKVRDHDQIINRLGNLTLLGRKLNQALQNAKFSLKRDNEAYGYRMSDLKITKELSMPPYDTLEQWTAEQITERQTLMAEQAVGIWRI